MLYWLTNLNILYHVAILYYKAVSTLKPLTILAVCHWWPRIPPVLAEVEIIPRRSGLLRSQYRHGARHDLIAAALCAAN